MFIEQESPITQNILNEARLSCCIQQNMVYYGLDERNSSLLIDDYTECKRVNLKRSYCKITYNPCLKLYYAVCDHPCSGTQCIYVLDHSFQEIDCIRLGVNSDAELRPRDLWFDPINNLLYFVTSAAIYRFNTNGDYLGIFMQAPPGRKYKAICSHGNLVFIAYESNSCLYIASYRPSGAFIDKINLGCEYYLCSMQVVFEHNYCTLQVLVYKNNRFPYIVKITLESSPQANTPMCSQGIEVECRQSDDIQVTCHVDYKVDCNFY